MHINIRGKQLNFTSPKVMGILNLTPDSFYDGGQLSTESELLHQAEKMLLEGAAILDLGGMSSRPGASIISADEELKRVLPAVTAILKCFADVVISIDTVHAQVADECLSAGAHIINDISAARYDDNILKSAAKHQVPLVLMHMQGLPASMQNNPQYENVTADVVKFFEERISACLAAGVPYLILDPGFGFGKTVANNYTLLSQLSAFKKFELPLMVGVSRKSMLCKPLSIQPEGALNATTAANMIALLNGANLLRVHDVKQAVECIRIYEEYKQASIKASSNYTTT